MIIRLFTSYIIFQFILSVSLFATDGSLSPVGKWWVEGNESQIEIYEKDGKLFGRIAWTLRKFEDDGREKLDYKNPDKSLRNRHIQSFDFITDLVKVDGQKYCNGSLYNPKDGRTYSCEIELKSENKLRLKGYIGHPMLGKNVLWDRVTDEDITSE